MIGRRQAEAMAAEACWHEQAADSGTLSAADAAQARNAALRLRDELWMCGWFSVEGERGVQRIPDVEVAR